MCILSFAAATRALISVWRYWLVFRLHPISSSRVTLGAVGSRTGFRICRGPVVRQDPSLMCWLSSSQGYWPKSQLLESWADSKSLCKSVRLRTVICFHLVSGYLCSLAPLETCLSWWSTGVFPLISAGLRVFQFSWTTIWFQLCQTKCYWEQRSCSTDITVWDKKKIKKLKKAIYFSTLSITLSLYVLVSFTLSQYSGSQVSSLWSQSDCQRGKLWSPLAVVPRVPPLNTLPDVFLR